MLIAAEVASTPGFDRAAVVIKPSGVGGTRWEQLVLPRQAIGTGSEILFSPARLPLWIKYFSNDNVLYGVNNRVGAVAVERDILAVKKHRAAVSLFTPVSSCRTKTRPL